MVDASSSIGWAGFQVQKDFILTLVETEVSITSRIGFIMFSSKANVSRSIQFWDSKHDLTSYVDGIYYERGYTNTSGAMSAALSEFDDSFVPDREQILILLTDGNPCITGVNALCPFSLCDGDPYDFGTQFDAKGIPLGITVCKFDKFAQSQMKRHHEFGDWCWSEH